MQKLQETPEEVIRIKRVIYEQDLQYYITKKEAIEKIIRKLEELIQSLSLQDTVMNKKTEVGPGDT